MGKYIFLSFLIIWYCAFVAGFAFGQTNQDCTYVNKIMHDLDGKVVSSTQEYICKTPPKVVEIHTYPNKNAHDVMQTKVYGLTLDSYENPTQVLYNMDREIQMNRAITQNNLQFITTIGSFLSMFN